MRPLVIRADATAAMGSGHLVRALALGQAWSGTVIVATASAADDRIARAGARCAPLAAAAGSLDDARATAAVARDAGAPCVVVDGYHFDAAYHRVLRAGGLQTVCIDDNGEAGEYVADIVLNQNLHATSALYDRRDAGTELLLGPGYVLLRPEFADAASQRRVVPDAARRILVTLGGGAPRAGILERILDGLTQLRAAPLDVTVLTGGAIPPAVRTAADRVDGRVDLRERSDDMRGLMADADLAISAAGSTTWELACMGVPAALVVAAANQRDAAAAATAHGIAVLLGDATAVRAGDVRRIVAPLAADPARRAAMAAAGRRLIDGRGAARVAQAIHRLISAPAPSRMTG